MCGISGIVSKNNSVDSSLIILMNEIIAHRGPDDEGYLSYNSETKEISNYKRKEDVMSEHRCNLYFGHRRLSILDLSDSAHQPFHDDSGRYHLIFNGEIYNYIELRQMLPSDKYVFRSESDTEVLLYLYMEYGKNCLDMLNGMWAFVILDSERNLIFGSRDRFGVKPFYYFFDGSYFCFASEIKALLKLPYFRKGINPIAAFDYISTGRVQDNCITMFNNISELEPSGSFTLELSNFKFIKEKYFTLSYIDKWEKFSSQKAKEYSEIIRNKIFNAVNIRLRSDVKVGSCLSGGVDSSAIVCTINSLLSKKSISQIGEHQKVFTASFPNTDIDETTWAGIVAESANVEWLKTMPTAYELMEDIEKLVYIQDVPFGSTTIYTQYRVMKLASENGVKVLLDGQGGDELFTGYSYFLRPYYNEMIRNLDFRSILNEYRNIGNSPVSSQILLRTLTISFAKIFLPTKLKRFLLRKKDQEINYLNNLLYNRHVMRLGISKLKEFSTLNSSLHDQFTFSSLGELLKYEDRNSMHFSIEARTPFADDIDLIQYVFNIPASYKIRDGWTKYLLRESMKGIIPDKIRLRTDKLGFATPEYYWLNTLKDNFRDYFTNDLNDYFKIDAIKTDWDSIFNSQERCGITNFWRFINFAIWKKVYGV
ncbi:MAG: glutamine-hydrolyzing asparagine synthase [Chlorobi bacterium OLB4]|jgi:asparagine synthase (glutamine-hydrolyzing)|nr:MAG: glutamine-hydrolyzing asparagine synthase [Chlorobi bacterium OLB4]MBW7854814.1 asparagine synthase (glutamine-hydrolyzing) [Ignavibacteria bacterium]OQY78396.1 MAG: asparagine synthase (glutamine-hydrolyzing) [Ignavibacteriales bacterium UTCHB1]